MPPFQEMKRVRSNLRPRGPAPHLPAPAVGRLKAVPSTQANGGTTTATAPVCPANVYTQPVYSPVQLQQPPIPVAAPTVPAVTQVLNQVVNVLNQFFLNPTAPFLQGNGLTPIDVQIPTLPPGSFLPPFLPPSSSGFPPSQVGFGSGPLFVLGKNFPAVKNTAAVNNGSTANTKTGKWAEVDRQTEDVRVENPDDKDQYVIIRRINSLTMRNTSTGEIWRFIR